MFQVDSPGYYDDTLDNNNERLNIRRQKVKESKDMDMMCRLHSDIFTQHRCVLMVLTSH